MEWRNSCENSRPVAGVWAVCFIWSLAGTEAFAFCWRNSASCDPGADPFAGFFADIFALWEQFIH